MWIERCSICGDLAEIDDDICVVCARVIELDLLVTINFEINWAIGER